MKTKFLAAMILALFLFSIILSYSDPIHQKTTPVASQNELAFLQAQIKPHFIFNTINTIISFCYSDGERAADLLANFSKYLRLAFDVNNRTQTITLSREIDIVRVYVKIEQARFSHRIQVE